MKEFALKELTFGRVTGIFVIALAAAADPGLTTGRAITVGCISEAAAM